MFGRSNTLQISQIIQPQSPFTNLPPYGSKGDTEIPISSTTISPQSKTKRASRRTSQRGSKRSATKILNLQQMPYNNSINRTKTLITQKYGFTADPQHSKHKNFNNAITTIVYNSQTLLTTNKISPNKHSLFLQQPKNLTTHNLCKGAQLPPGTTNLLGLGQKFCLATSKPTPDIKDTVQKLAYKIRTKFYL